MRGRRLARTLAALVALAGLAGCASGGGALAVASDWDPQARFAGLRGWDWLPPAPASGDDAPPPAPAVDARVRAAVADELAARGWPRDPGAPDFWVFPIASVEDVVAPEARAYYAQLPPWMRDALRDTHAIEGRRGVLVIDVFDPATRLPIWRGVVSGAIDPAASPAQRERRLREAVRRVLAGFPPEA